MLVASALVAGVAVVTRPAEAAKPKKKKVPPPPEPVKPVEPPKPLVTEPPKAEPVKPAEPKPADPSTTKPGAGDKVPQKAPEKLPDPAPHKQVAKPLDPGLPRPRSTFEGFILGFDVGYGTAGGEDGPLIPVASSPGVDTSSVQYKMANDAWKQQRIDDRTHYDQGVTTSKGGGLSVALRIGYNIKGFVSLWADMSGHMSPGSGVDLAGGGTVAAMLGLHPVSWFVPEAPYDVKLYGGYGFFDILGYKEAVFQQEAKGKAWTGSALPFGVAFAYKFDRLSAFAMGLDLRFVRASYDKWIYNNDKDLASRMDDDPVKTLRFEPRLTFGWNL